MVTGFCISGPALAVVGLRGEFKRGIIWNGEAEMHAICAGACAGNRHSAVSVVKHSHTHMHTRDSECVLFFFREGWLHQLCSDLP